MRQLKGYSNNTISRPTSGIGNLIFSLMNSATIFHIAHLTVKGPGSFAAHKAMGEYYEGIVDLIDSLAEQYQGASMSIITYPTEATIPTLKTPAECCSYLMGLKNMIDMEQSSCMYSEIVNVMDEIKSHIDSTCYKLNFLS